MASSRGFTIKCGYGHYVRLMDNFHIVVDVFLRLSEPMQKVIADITRRMGAGMAEFIVKDVKTVKEYDLYCHYVAGLVGIGLSQLFGRWTDPHFSAPNFYKCTAW